MNHLPIPANTICVDGRQWDISNLLMAAYPDTETTNCSTPSSPSTLTSSHQSLRRLNPSNIEHSSLQSPEMNDDECEDVKMGTKKNQYCDEDEKEYEKEYYYAYDEVDGLYPTLRPETPPTVDEVFRHQPQRRNISDFDIKYSSHSNRSFAIPRSNHDSDDDDCSALTFNDDGSGLESFPQGPLHAFPQFPPVFTPSKPRPMIEVMPDQFLPLRGSDETLFYVEHGFCREANCLYCSTTQYFIHDVTMVMCPGCRLIFAPEATSSNHNQNNNLDSVTGSLGLGLRVDEADAIFRHQRQLRAQRNRSSPHQQLQQLQQQYSQRSLINTAVAAASTSAPNDKASAAAAASTTARNLLLRRQASLSRFRGSQHSKRSTISEGSRAA